MVPRSSCSCFQRSGRTWRSSKNRKSRLAGSRFCAVELVGDVRRGASAYFRGYGGVVACLRFDFCVASRFQKRTGRGDRHKTRRESGERFLASISTEISRSRHLIFGRSFRHYRGTDDRGCRAHRTRLFLCGSRGTWLFRSPIRIGAWRSSCPALPSILRWSQRGRVESCVSISWPIPRRLWPSFSDCFG